MAIIYHNGNGQRLIIESDKLIGFDGDRQLSQEDTLALLENAKKAGRVEGYKLNKVNGKLMCELTWDDGK